jgi:hypothetical protein
MADADEIVCLGVEPGFPLQDVLDPCGFDLGAVVHERFREQFRDDLGVPGAGEVE